MAIPSDCKHQSASKKKVAHHTARGMERATPDGPKRMSYVVSADLDRGQELGELHLLAAVETIHRTAADRAKPP